MQAKNRRGSGAAKVDDEGPPVAGVGEPERGKKRRSSARPTSAWTGACCRGRPWRQPADGGEVIHALRWRDGVPFTSESRIVHIHVGSAVGWSSGAPE